MLRKGICTRILYEALLDYAYRYLIKANENWRGLGLGQILCLRIVWGYAETFPGYLFLPGYDYSYDINIVDFEKNWWWPMDFNW